MKLLVFVKPMMHQCNAVDLPSPHRDVINVALRNVGKHPETHARTHRGIQKIPLKSVLLVLLTDESQWYPINVLDTTRKCSQPSK